MSGLIVPGPDDVDVVADLAAPVPAIARATGLPGWSGTDPLEACRAVFGELGTLPGLPFLPQLPGRGPGADPVGRSLSLLVDLPVDLQPSGWRLVDRPGRDLQRAVSYLVADADALAEAADGFAGSVTLSVLGPWTLAGLVWLPRGERVACDPGAARDLSESLAEGVARHVGAIRGLVAGASVEVIVDEPGLPAALEGRLPTMSGYSRLRAIEAGVAQETLTAVLDRVRAAGADRVGLRCTTANAPLPLLRNARPDVLGVDLLALTPRAAEGVAIAIEDGVRVLAGVLDPTVERLPKVPDVVDRIARRFREVGLSTSLLTMLNVAPTRDNTAVAPKRAVAVLALLREVASALTEVAAQ